MAGRLREDTLERVIVYGQRILKLAEELEADRRPRRLIDQVVGSGTSVGANLFEAHEAMSRMDFVKCLSITAKELHETVFWIEVMTRQGYFSEQRLAPLLNETRELLAIVKTLIARTRKKSSS